jgi:Mlc titration factor MtfA (ptsG expression regulator)
MYGSDIDLYGATNATEFFAVISEYFFEQPDLLKANHPDLYKMLEKIYKTG